MVKLEEKLGPCAPVASFTQYHCGQGDWECFSRVPANCPFVSIGVFPDRESVSLRPAQLSFNNCALVGASPILNGAGHGADIDSHDTVIRVNRLPTPEYADDFGKKTDVYFANLLIARQGKTVLMGGEETSCKDSSQPACNYKFVVLKALKPTADEWALSLKYWDGTVPIPVGVQLDWVDHTIETRSHNFTLDNMLIDAIATGTLSSWWNWANYRDAPPGASLQLQKIFAMSKVNVTVVRD